MVTIGTLLGGAVGFYMQKQYTLSEKVRLVVNTARCMLACCACGADKAELFAASRPVLKLALRKKLSGGVGRGGGDLRLLRAQLGVDAAQRQQYF